MTCHDPKLAYLININNIAATPRDRLTLVLLRSRQSHQTQRSDACTIPFFVDTNWSIRALLRHCHVQLRAHRSRSNRNRRHLIDASSSVYFCDSSTDNALLAFTNQSSDADRLPSSMSDDNNPPPLDGSYAAPNDDPVFEQTIGNLMTQNYITTYNLCLDKRKDKSSISLAAAMREAQSVSSDVAIVCASVADAYLTQNHSTDADRERLTQTCSSVRCNRHAWCSCLLDATIQRSSRVIRLDTVSAPFDATSRCYNRRLFDIRSPLVLRHVARAELRSPGSAVQIVSRCSAKCGDTCSECVADINDIPLRINGLTYDDIRRALPANKSTPTTIGAWLGATRAFDDIDIVRRALTYVAEPARHYIRVAISGFDQYLVRLYTTYALGNCVLLCEARERAVFSELLREPDKTLAFSRVLAFEPDSSLKPLDGTSYTSVAHDDLVVYAIVIAHMIHVAEQLAQRRAQPRPVGYERSMSRWDVFHAVARETEWRTNESRAVGSVY